MDQAISKIVEAYKGYESEGWTKQELVSFSLECIEILIPEAQKFADMTGADKKAWVVNALTAAYFAVNPDIKWIPEPLETKLEEWAIKRIVEDVVSPAIDWLVSFMKKKNII